MSPDEARAFVEELRNYAVVVEDPSEVEAGVTSDPKDDYLVALARAARANVLVSGDAHITDGPGLEPPRSHRGRSSSSSSVRSRF